jgi:diguanylate cyclase (GGDEF)-like protein
MAPDILLLVAVAAVGIRMAVLHGRLRTLEAQVIRDPLTGAFNRRHMQVTLAAAVERRRRSGERASLLLIDIDRFKDVNDAFGHAEGDRVLKELVVLVGQRLRKLDALFRTGGEEFSLLLSGAGFTEALVVAESLRGLVQNAGLTPGRRLSISIGVVELGPGQAVSDWIAEADAALYRAKRTGRNRVAGRSSAPALGLVDADNRLSFSART